MPEQDEVDERDAADETLEEEDQSEEETEQEPEPKREPKPKPKPEPARESRSRQDKRDEQFRQKYKAEKEARERLEQELADRDAKVGDWEKVAKRQRRQIEELTGERDQFKGEFEGLTKRLNTDALVEKIATVSGVESRARIKGLIAYAVSEGTDLDPSPESASDRDVKDWIKEMQSHDPTTFEPPKSGKKQSPAPGNANRHLGEGERPDEKPWQRIIADAKQHGGSRKW